MRAHTRRLVQQLLLLLGILLLPICSTVLPPPTSQYTYLAADQEVPVDNLTDLTAVTSQEQLQQLQGLDTGLAAKFDFWILALSWPPSLVPVPAQSRARHAVIRHEAHAGFWTHGLWPVSNGAKILEYCSKQHLDPHSLSGFEPALRFYLRSGHTQADASGDVKFWDHEWLRHGTCSDLDQLGYFLSVFKASAAVDPAAAFRAVGLLPSNLQPYTLQQVTAVLSESYSSGFNPHLGLKCGTAADGRLRLQEVRICLTKDLSATYNCSGYASWVKPGIHLDTCGADPSAALWLPEFNDKGADLGFPWALLGILGGAVSLLLLVLFGGFQLLRHAGKLPAVFQPRRVQLVHYDLVHTPVRVLCEPVDMAHCWQVAPYIAEFMEELPQGMGIKGGIARKLLKHLYGTPEPPGSFDIDVLVFIDQYTPSDRRAARELVTGMRLGGLVLEAKDVEVMTKGWLLEYFTSRDVTLNEVLILKHAPGQAVLYYTRDAVRDAQLQLVRPSVHGLKSEYNMNWQVELNGTPYTSPSQVCRCLVRYLKGHGTDYAFDASTWAHYRRERLNNLQLFKVLRPFHDDSVAMQVAVDHLIDIGFLARRDVIRAGGVNMLWGLLLKEVNATVAQNGGRLTLGELDTEGVERWVDHKKAQVASKLIAEEMRGRRTGFMPADESVIDLGLLHLPAVPHLELLSDSLPLTCRCYPGPGQREALACPEEKPPCHPVDLYRFRELQDYIASGATFDISQQLDQQTGTAMTHLSSSMTSEGPVNVPASKKVWAAQRDITEASSDALLSIARHSFSTPSGTSSQAAWLSHSPQLARLLSSEGGPEEGDISSSNQTSPQPGGSSSSSQRRIDALESIKRRAAERSNKAYKQQGQATASARASPEPPAADASSSQQPPSTHQSKADAAGDDDLGAHERVWLPYSQVGTCWSDAGATAPDGVKMQLGTFYQVMDSADILQLQDGEREYAELIADEDRPQRKRLPVWQLLHFALGVALLNLRLLAAAYGLLLLGLVFRLAVPRVEGAIFDAFNVLEMSSFRWNLAVAVGLVAADLVCSFSGRITLELFARQTMSQLFAAFFDHILGQDITFFSKLSAGELMARTSGDSLTLRSMFTATAYQLTEGSALVLGSAGCLALTLGHLWIRAPSLATVLLLGLLSSGLEGFATGLLARTLNLKVRQSLGRMFGFSLDVFSKMDAVGALGLEGRLLADYKSFARDYFSNTFKLNCLLVFHKSYTFGLAAVVRGAMLWFGGVALFADLTTVGTLFMMLRYVTWMQRGIKQASDAYARVAASVGSLERIVELHDRGVFRDAAHALGVEELPVVDDDDNDAAAAQTAASAVSDEGLLKPLLQKRHAGRQLPWWKRLWNRKPRQVEVRVLAPEVRPDFSSMLGGVRLEGVHLTLRSKTDRLVLSDASLEVAAGHAAIITGAAGGGKSSLLQLILLRHIPYKGYIAFQLPTSALPQTVSTSSSVAAAAPQGATAALTDDQRYSVTQASTRQAPASPSSHAAAAAAAADYDCSRGPAASLAYGTAPGGDGWLWAQFSFLKDDQKAARAAMAMVSVSTAVLFRTSVEDNVACAAREVVVSADVRAVCQRVGAHDTIMTLPDGYRTLVGEGSGTIVSWALMLQLALARALIRRPKLLLLDDADQFAAVVGRRRLVGILQELQEQRGVTVVMAAADPGVFVSRGLAAAVYRLQDGQLYAL